MADYRSDAARRRRTVGLLDVEEPAPEDRAGLMEAMSVVGVPAAVGHTIRAAPRVVGGLLGSGVFNIGSANEAEAQSRKGPAPKVTQEDEAMASKLPEHMRGEFMDLRARGRSGSLNRNDRVNLDRMNGIIANSATAADDEQRRVRAGQLARAEEDRAKVLAAAPKTFQEQFGGAASFVPIAPLVAGFASMLPPAAMGARAARTAANDWRKATDAGLMSTNAAELARHAQTAKGFSDQFPKPTLRNQMAPYAVPAGIGGAEGAFIANIPDEWNASLPPENPERKAAEAYLKQLSPDHPAYEQAKRVFEASPVTNPARDAALSYFSDPWKVVPKTLIGGLQGAGGGALATSVGKWGAPSEKFLPRAQTSALQARMAGQGLDDATTAIRAETEASRHVLPIPPQRQQMPAQPLPEAPAAPRGLLEDIGPPPQLLPPAQPAAPISIRTAHPPSRGRFADPNEAEIAQAALRDAVAAGADAKTIQRLTAEVARLGGR